MRRVSINEFLSDSRNGLLLDVRSPGEYTHAHIPGAVSLPLFTDEERKVVGTAYKQQSREAAIKIGLDYFGPKMRGTVEEVEKLTADRWPLAGTNAANDQRTMANVFLYCWRGGMRSGAVAWLLNLYGFNVTVLAGGYKAFRNHVLRSFTHAYPLKVLGGYTGSGKTALLKELHQRGERVIDLEALASHKGSAFGSLGMPPQPAQEMFENLLSCELLKLNGEWSAVSGVPESSTLTTHHTPPTIWLEDESQRIGHVNIPKSFWETMRRAPVFFLDIPFEQRLENIVQEYGVLDAERMIAAVQRIGKRLGGLETKNAIQFLQERKLADAFRILLQYYDKQYRKGLHNRDNLASLLTTVSCSQSGANNTERLLNAQQLPAHERTP